MKWYALGSRGRRTQKGAAVRVVAGVGALSLLGAVVAGGAVGTVTEAEANARMNLDVVRAAQTADSSNKANVQVGKSVGVNAYADGTVQDAAFFVTTNVSGDVSGPLTIPVGSQSPVDVSSLAPLNMDGDSIVYDLQNSGLAVQKLIASVGSYDRELPVRTEVELLVDGKKVDPNTATSITGDVQLTYKFTNLTAKNQDVEYTSDSGEKTGEGSFDIPVQFGVAFSAAFSNGWADLTAPWANTGFSTDGQLLTGEATLAPTILNDWNPNGELQITARAENASLPAVLLVMTPQSTAGSVTDMVGKPVAQYGPEAVNLLEGKALPFLNKIQEEAGGAINWLSTLLATKVDPALIAISKLNLDPAKAEEELVKIGDQAKTYGDLVFNLNGTVEGLVAKVAETVRTLTDPASQAKLAGFIKQAKQWEGYLAEFEGMMDVIADLLDEYLGYLNQPIDNVTQQLLGKSVYTLYIEQVQAAIKEKLGFLPPESVQKAIAQDVEENIRAGTGLGICGDWTGTHPPCIGQQSAIDLIDDLMLDNLPDMCTVGLATSELWNTGTTYKDAMATGISKLSGDEKAALEDVQSKLNAQTLDQPGTDDCVDGANGVKTSLDGFLNQLTDLGQVVRDFEPLVAELDKIFKDVIAELEQIEAIMPLINGALNKPCSATTIKDPAWQQCGVIQAMELVANANKEAVTKFNEGIDRILVTIEPVIGQVFGVVNDLAAAAPPIQDFVDGLPGLLTEIVYGDLGQIKGEVEELNDLAKRLTHEAQQAVAVNEAMDARFQAGDGFPYGSADGDEVATSAVYRVQLQAAGAESPNPWLTIGFAVILLVLASGFGTWLHRRNSA